MNEERESTYRFIDLFCGIGLVEFQITVTVFSCKKNIGK